MEITRHVDSDRHVVKLTGKLDALSSRALHEQLEAALANGARHLVLNMQDITFMSSAGIRTLQDFHGRVLKLKGTLAVSPASDFVREMFEIVGLFELLSPDAANPSAAAGPRLIDAPPLRLAVSELDAAAVFSRADLAPEGARFTFPATTISAGIGAMCVPPIQCGTVLAAAGYCAFKSPAEQFTPDYMIHADEFVPELFLRSGVRLSGNFARFVDFTAGEPIALDSLAPHLLRLGEAAEAVLILAAEATAVVGSWQSIPEAAACAGGAPSRREESVLFAAGVLTASGLHVHAAVFAYAPLRSGPQKLADTVASVFEQPLLDVLHLDSGTLLKRGAAWLAPVAARA